MSAAHPLRDRRTQMIEDLRNNVPHELRELQAWLAFKLVPKNDGSGKFDKIPFYSDGGKRYGMQGSAEDTDRLTEFSATFDVLSTRPEYDGIGVAVLPCHPLGALDLDDIEASPERRALADECRASGMYCEISPSGRGLRLLYSGKTDLGNRKNHAIGLEIFESSGFVTVTGNEISKCADLVPMPPALRERIAGLLASSKSTTKPAGKAPGYAIYALDSLPSQLREAIKRGYPQRCDRSARCYGMCWDLRRAGTTQEQAFQILGDTDLPWLAPALERRGGDIASAREWMWKYVVAPAYAQPLIVNQNSGGNTTESAAADGWPEPVNILAQLAARKFGSDDVPAVLGEYPIAFAQSTGIDPSITITAAVSAAAAALSDRFQIVADSLTRWMQSARLWLLNIGPPGTGKTPGHREMLAPLWAMQRELLEEYERTVRDLPADEKDNPPPKPRVVLVDATIEALSEVLRHHPRGVLIANDEFEGFLGAMDMYRGKGGASRDRAEYLRLFDGGPHTVERVQRGSIFIDNWGVSILSATTPATLSKLSRHLPEDGLLQRFIVVCAQRQALSVVPTIDIEQARERYHETIRRLYNAQLRAHQGKVPLSIQAAELFSRWRIENQRLQEAMGSVSPPFEAHLAKYPTLVLRTALTFHAAQIINLPDEAARDIAAWPVPVETMKQAIAFMRRAAQHASPVYLDMKGGSDAFELGRDIGRAIIAHGGAHIARRDLIQRVRAFRAASPEVQSAALGVLTDAGWIRHAEGGYSKAQPARFEINPLLAVRMAEEAKRERERRAAVRELIAEASSERRPRA